MDLTNPRVIQQQLASIRWKPARGKHFGQHFLVARNALEGIVAALALTAEDAVLEIGPGLGVLTMELAARAGRVLAVEKDATLVPSLKRNIAAFSNVTIINADVLTVEPKNYQLPITNYLLAGNLPYSITVPVIERFILDSIRAPKRAVFLVQKEVAERLTDPPGGKHRGAMTVLLEEAATTEIIGVVSAHDFFPVPEVDGAVVRITPHTNHESAIRNPSPPRRDPAMAGQFSNFIFSVFRHRRKQLLGTLRKLFPSFPVNTVRERLISSAIDPRARAQELTLEQWRSLFCHFVL